MTQGNGGNRLMTGNTKTGSGKVGRKSTKPLCVIYKIGDETFAALVDPNQDDRKEVSSTGPYAALGILRDKQFGFGEIFSKDIPSWVKKKIPKGGKIVGACNITNFPLML